MRNALDTTFDHKDAYRILGVTADATPVVDISGNSKRLLTPAGISDSHPIPSADLTSPPASPRIPRCEFEDHLAFAGVARPASFRPSDLAVGESGALHQFLIRSASMASCYVPIPTDHSSERPLDMHIPEC